MTDCYVITRQTISYYVRSSGSPPYACLLDAVALVLAMRKDDCVSICNDLVKQAEKRDVLPVIMTFEDGDYACYDCADIINILLSIPGKNARVRLINYAEVIVEYLKGDRSILDTIKKPDEETFSLTFDERPAVEEVSPSIEMSLHEYLEQVESVLDVYILLQKRCIELEENDMAIRSIQKRSKDARGVYDRLRTTPVKRLLGDAFGQLENTLEGMQTKKIKLDEYAYKPPNMDDDNVPGEVRWRDVIRSLNLEPDYTKTLQCGKLASKRKRELNEVVEKVDRHMRGKIQSVNVYYEEDRDFMEGVVRSVYGSGGVRVVSD